MIDLERKLASVRLRVWGLVVNFIANIIALYGLAGILNGRDTWLVFISGSVLTLLCLLVLAMPVLDKK